MKPILEEFKNKVKDEVTILKIDVDKNPKVSQAYQIQGVPTLILFSEGKIKWRQSGVVSAQDLQKVVLKFR
jgi:thioredoxin 1